MFDPLPGKPYFCNYWMTYKCNSKCEFCSIWRNPELKGLPDARFTDVQNNLEDLKKIGVRMIDFTGGEPLLNKELPQILSYAKELGFFVKLATNGYLYPEKADDLKGLTNRIYFSFDTTSSEEYEKIRGINGYHRVLDSIQIAKKLKQDFCLFCTITDDHIHNLERIIKFSQQQKTVIYLHPCFSYFDNKPLNKKNISTLKKYFWQPYVRMNLPQLDFHYKGGNRITHSTCKVGQATLDIGPDDCLTIPCFHRCQQRIKINAKLYSLFTSPEWKKLFQHAGQYEFCNHCTIDCYFGLSYWDRLSKYFFKQNLTYLKGMLEAHRP